MLYREKTKVIKIGNKVIGGGNPIMIQSMTNTKTEDAAATVNQILRLQDAGCDIIRCTVPNIDAARAIAEIKKEISIPLVADIHFDYRMAIAAIENGADKIRINPGNIGNEERIKKDDFLAVIEIPKGCKNKYELDKKTGALRLDRVLYTATHYPANYGFIPRTYAGDHDPLDVLVLCQEEIYPLTLVECYPIGVLRMTDSGEDDEKIIAIPKKDPFLNEYRDISEIPAQTSAEIMHFFEVYKQLEGKVTSVDKMMGREEAEKIIQEALENYKKEFENK